MLQKIISDQKEIKEKFTSMVPKMDKLTFKIFLKSDSYVGFDWEEIVEVKIG